MTCFMAISAHGPHSDFRSLAFPRHSAAAQTILDLPIKDQTTNLVSTSRIMKIPSNQQPDPGTTNKQMMTLPCSIGRPEFTLKITCTTRKFYKSMHSTKDSTNRFSSTISTARWPARARTDKYVSGRKGCSTWTSSWTRAQSAVEAEARRGAATTIGGRAAATRTDSDTSEVKTRTRQHREQGPFPTWM